MHARRSPVSAGWSRVRAWRCSTPRAARSRYRARDTATLRGNLSLAMICEPCRMRFLAFPAALLLLTASAVAAEDAPKDKKKAEEPGTHVQMPFLIAPMSADGKLQGYAYISSKLVASTPMASVEIRDKLAFIQDAFVRDVNAQPIGKANDPIAVDEPALAKRLTADAKQIVGAAKVVTVTFTQIQFSPIQPK